MNKYRPVITPQTSPIVQASDLTVIRSVSVRSNYIEIVNYLSTVYHLFIWVVYCVVLSWCNGQGFFSPSYQERILLLLHLRCLRTAVHPPPEKMQTIQRLLSVQKVQERFVLSMWNVSMVFCLSSKCWLYSSGFPLVLQLLRAPGAHTHTQTYLQTRQGGTSMSGEKRNTAVSHKDKALSCIYL